MQQSPHAIDKLLGTLNQNDITEGKLTKICETARKRLEELKAGELLLAKEIKDTGIKHLILKLVPSLIAQVSEVVSVGVDKLGAAKEKIADIIPRIKKRKADDTSDEIELEEPKEKKPKTQEGKKDTVSKS